MTPEGSLLVAVGCLAAVDEEIRELVVDRATVLLVCRVAVELRAAVELRVIVFDAVLEVLILVAVLVFEDDVLVFEDDVLVFVLWEQECQPIAIQAGNFGYQRADSTFRGRLFPAYRRRGRTISSQIPPWSSADPKPTIGVPPTTHFFRVRHICFHTNRIDQTNRPHRRTEAKAHRPAPGPRSWLSTGSAASTPSIAAPEFNNDTWSKTRKKTGSSASIPNTRRVAREACALVREIGFSDMAWRRSMSRERMVLCVYKAVLRRFVGLQGSTDGRKNRRRFGDDPVGREAARRRRPADSTTEFEA